MPFTEEEWVGGQVTALGQGGGQCVSVSRLGVWQLGEARLAGAALGALVWGSSGVAGREETWRGESLERKAVTPSLKWRVGLKWKVPLV